MASPLAEWIRQQGERARVSDAVDPTSERSSATCGGADRTMYATRAIAEGDVLVELSDGAVLNGSVWLARHAEPALEIAKAGELKEQLEKLQPSGAVLTALALLAERARGESSAFHGYIQQLPARVPLPLTWSAEAKAKLQATAACPIIDDGLVENVFQRFAKPLTTTFPTLWGKAGVDFDVFRWAFSIVSSRAFAVSDTREPTLLPVIDMANHEPVNPAAAIRKADASDNYSLVALRAIDADSPVTISYGDLSNAQLLCRYGFTLPDVTLFDTVLVSSTHVRAVFAQLTSGGSVDAALAQLERLAQDEAEARVAAPAAEADRLEEDGRAEEPAVKRRKLFEPVVDHEEVSFALHGDASQEFGLGDGLMGFVFANELPMDALYDVLTVLLQHTDKRLSAVLVEESASLSDPMETRLARALAAREREVCRRILLGILSVEEDSEEEEAEEGEEED